MGVSAEAGVIFHNSIADFLRVDWARMRSEPAPDAADELRAILGALDRLENEYSRCEAWRAFDGGTAVVDEHEDQEVGHHSPASTDG